MITEERIKEIQTTTPDKEIFDICELALDHLNSQSIEPRTPTIWSEMIPKKAEQAIQNTEKN